MRDAMSVLIRPVVSEKSYGLMDKSVYVFIVDPRATKIEVRHAVEQAFGVRVHQRQHAQPQGEGDAQPAHQRQAASAPTPSAPSSRCIPTTPSTSSIADQGIAMPLRSRKPTSPGRRFQTVSDFSEITRDRPEKSLLAPNPQSGGRNNHGRKTSRHRGGGHKQQYRVVDFRRNKDGDPGQGGGHRVRPQPQRAHRPAALRRRREALHPGAGRGEGGRQAPERPGRRHPPGQRPAPALHPGGLDHPQRRAAARRWRQDGPRRRHERPAGGQGRRLRHPAAALDRDAPCLHRLPGHPRAWSATPRPSWSRWARPGATAGRASARRRVAWP